MRGRDKLLEPVAGMPVLRRLSLAALQAAAGADDGKAQIRVAVMLRPSDPARRAALHGLDLAVLPVTGADEGMAASVRCAADWAIRTGADGLILCPADMPELQAEDFSALAQSFNRHGPPLRAASADGKAGHPVLFPAGFLPALAKATGDSGARFVLRCHPPRLIPRPGSRAVTDLDTPEDWAAWRAGRHTP